MPEIVSTQHASSGRPLLEAASPATRKLLIRSRVLAMRGGLEDSLRSLRDAYQATPADRTPDRVALGLLQAELLHLDQRHAEAAQVFDQYVASHSAGLTAEQRFSVEQNRSDLQLAVWPPAGTDDFYNLIDRKRLLGFDWLDYRDLFEAKQDSDQGKHHKALPLLWQQLRRSYYHACWRAQRWVTRTFAAECVALKEWQDAVHHAVLCRDDSFVPAIADGLLSARRAEVIGDVLDRVLSIANLREHFVVAAKLLAAVADAIPDDRLVRLADWLLVRAAETRAVHFGANPLVGAWEVLRRIGARLPIATARRFIQAAVTHPAWTTKLDDPNRVIAERGSIVQAVTHLVYAVPPSDVGEIASSALPLILDRPQISDYDEVVNLLCHLANRGGEGVKAVLGAALYPPGQPVDVRLAQVAEVFGKAEAFEGTQVSSFAERVARQVRLGVQRVGPGETAETPGERLYEFFAPIPGGTLKVYSAPVVSLHAVARQRAKLSEPAIAEVVRAVLDLARERDNFCSNRAALLAALREFADVAPPGLREEVVGAVEPVARGPVEESPAYQSAAEADNPLNATKHRTGGPEDVQGAALITLAAFGSRDPALTARLTDVLEDALCDHRPAIRRAAYAAVRQLPEVTEGLLLGVLTGLRDPDASAAVSAFAALASQTGWKLNRNHWRLFVLAARLGSQSPNAKLRQHVAGALAAWAPRCPPGFRADVQELLAGLATDISAAVREFACPAAG